MGHPGTNTLRCTQSSVNANHLSINFWGLYHLWTHPFTLQKGLRIAASKKKSTQHRGPLLMLSCGNTWPMGNKPLSLDHVRPMMIISLLLLPGRPTAYPLQVAAHGAEAGRRTKHDLPAHLHHQGCKPRAMKKPPLMNWSCLFCIPISWWYSWRRREWHRAWCCVEGSQLKICARAIVDQWLNEGQWRLVNISYIDMMWWQFVIEYHNESWRPWWIMMSRWGSMIIMSSVDDY